MLIIQWGHKRGKYTTKHKEISFKDKKRQLPLVMITTILTNNDTGEVEYGWVNWSTNYLFRKLFLHFPKKSLERKRK